MSDSSSQGAHGGSGGPKPLPAFLNNVLPNADFTRCVLHFGKSKWNSDQSVALAAFCESQKDTVDHWITGRRFPQGEYRLRAQVFLSLTGYKVSEVERLDEGIRDLCELVALKAFTVDDLARELNYKGESDGKSQLYQVLLQGRSMMPDRMRKARALADSYLNILQEKRKEFVRFKLVITESAELSALPVASLPVMETVRPNPVSAAKSENDRPDTRVKGTDPSTVVTVKQIDTEMAVSVALVRSLHKHVKDLVNGRPERIREFRDAADGIGELAELLLAIDSGTI